MDSAEQKYGSLIFLRKDGRNGTTYPLYNGKITIGSSIDADIRLKINDKRLEEIHCIIEVNDNGIATVLNKSISEPVKINTAPIRKNRALCDKDELDIVGKKFLYINGNISEKNSDSKQKYIKEATPSKKRHSSACLTNLKSAKKTPNFRTKIPIQRRPPIRRLTASSTSSEFRVTYEKEPDKEDITERCKTTSKVIVSKALGSPSSSKKRRLSFGDNPKKFHRSAKMSTRNVLLDENIISSTITEEAKSPKLSVSMTKSSISNIQSDNWVETLDSDDLLSEESVKLNLSSNSSISPISSSPSTSSSSSSPRKSLRKSIRRSSLLKRCLKKNEEASLTKSGASRKRQTIGNEVNKQTEETDLSVSRSDIIKSRKSIRKSTVENEEPYLGEKSPIYDTSKETPSPNKSSARSRSSLITRNTRKMEKHDEEQSSDESEPICVINAKATPKQRTSLKGNSFMDEDKYHQDSSRAELSINLTNLKSPNKEMSEGRGSSARKSLRADGERARESLPTTSMRVREDEALEQRSSLRKSNRPNRNSGKLDSNEYMYLNVSAMSTPKDTLIKKSSTLSKIKESSGRKSNGPDIDIDKESSMNMHEDAKEQSSSEEFLALNISPMDHVKETSIKRRLTTPRRAFSSLGTRMRRESSARRSKNLNKNEQDEELSFGKESFDDVHALVSPKETSLPKSTTTPRESVISTRVSRVSSVRKSVRQSRNEEIDELSSAEESVSLNISTMNNPEKASIGRSSTTPKNISSVNPSNERVSSMRKRVRLSRNEEIGGVSSSEESMSLKISPMDSSEKTSIARSSTTPKNVFSVNPSKERVSSVRKSVRLSRNEEIGGLSSSEESMSLNISAMNSPEKTSIGRLSTPKNISSVNPSKERVSSVRKTIRLSKNEEIEGLSSNEESMSLNISAMNSPEKTSIGRLSTPKNISSVNPSKERVPSVRKSVRLNRNEEIGGLSSSEESMSLNISAMNSSEKTSIGRLLTPKNISSVNPSKEGGSSVRKSSRLNENKENSEVSSSEETLVFTKKTLFQRQLSTPKELISPISTPKERRLSVRKSNKPNLYEMSSDEFLDPNVLKINTPKEFLVPRRSTTTPVKRTPKKGGFSGRKSNELNESCENGELSSSEESLVLNLSETNSSEEKFIEKELTTPKETVNSARTSRERRSSVRKSQTPNRAGQIDMLSFNEELLIQNTSATNTPNETPAGKRLTRPRESISSDKIPREHISSARKSNRLNREQRIENVSSSEESFVLNVSGMNSPRDKSMQSWSSVSKKSISKLSADEDIEELLSSEELLNVSTMSSSNEKSTRNQSVKKHRSLSLNESRSSNRDSLIFDVSYSKNSTPISPRRRKNTTNQTMDQSIYSSQDESEVPLESPQDRNTPKLRHSSVRKSHLQNEEETSEMETSFSKSISSRTSSRRSSMNTTANKLAITPLTNTKQNISVVTLNDSTEGTPENHTSVIIIDTPFDKTRKSSHRLSKTLNSTLKDDTELTTPKSAIKSRRSKSQPYNPLIEDITPVTPLSMSKNESGFKTPLNTPGLFEDIKKSVLKSRSQMQSSTNLLEELNKTEPKKKGMKRLRESRGSHAGSSKRMKMQPGGTFDASDESYNSSFDSFTTDDALTVISEQNISQVTPKHFSDLTDKPVITYPRVKSLTEPKAKKPVSLRRSLHSMRLDSQISSADSERDVLSQTYVSFEHNLSNDIFEDISDLGSRRSSRRSSLRTHTTQDSSSSVRLQKTPKHDHSDVAALKKLLKTPKETKTFEDDLVLAKGMKTPTLSDSPKNELANLPDVNQGMSLEADTGDKVVGGTPKQAKSPRNDMRQIPNLRKLITPKQQNSPKNDLSDVAGLKRLLKTPKQVKSPKNDLRNIPNLRRLMSPKIENSPKNDLTNVEGIKKLFSIPTVQKSPRNDLTNVPNLRRIMSPKQQNSPKNDLTDVHGLKKMMRTPRERREPENDLRDVEGIANIFNMSGVQRLSIESDIENNEDLFDKLFAKKPLKTYRGKSLSPASRKASLCDDKRKTLGDVPYASPRVEKWIEEQAVIKSKIAENAKGDGCIERNLATPVKDETPDVKQKSQKRKVRGKMVEIKVVEETPIIETTGKEEAQTSKRAARGKKKAQDEVASESNEASLKMAGEDKNAIKTFVSEENEAGNKRRPNKKLEVPEVKLAKKSTRSRRKLDVVDNGQQSQEYPQIKQTADTVDEEQSNEVSNTNDEVNSTSIESEFKHPVKRGRTKKILQKDDTDQIPEVHSTTDDIESPALKQGRGRKAIDQIEEAQVVPSPRRGGRTRKGAQVEKLASSRKEVKEDELPQPKKIRGKRKSPVKKIEDSGNESDVILVEKAETPPKRGRGKKIKSTDEIIMVIPDTVHNIVREDEQVTDDPNSPVLTKRTRGRKQTTVESESGKICTKSKKVITSEPNLDVNVSEEPEVVHQNESEEDNAKVEKESKTGKKKVGRNKKKVVEKEIDGEHDQKEAEPVRATRGRRQPAASKVDVVEHIEVGNEETIDVKKMGRTKKKTDETSNVDDKTEITLKPTRGRKRNVGKTAETSEESQEGESESSEVIKKANKKNAENVEEEKTVRTTRGRKQKVGDGSGVDGENSVKPILKSLKGAVVENSIPVDSPRTARAKRGQFNKYGSDFVTEQKDKEKKQVRFEDKEDTKKRKGKDVAEVEVIEDTVRRSKRARK